MQIAIIKQEMNNHNSHRLGLRIGFRMAGTAFPWWNPKKIRNMSDPTNESLSGVGLWVSFAQLNEYTLSIRYTTIEMFTAYNIQLQKIISVHVQDCLAKSGCTRALNFFSTKDHLLGDHSQEMGSDTIATSKASG